MINLSNKFWDFIAKSNKWRVILFVFLGAFILRMPTLFMDYVHTDVLTTYIIVKRDMAGLVFDPNKGCVYHFLFKWSIKLFGDSPISFHFTGIIFILLTLIFIYLLGKKIYSERIGLIGALIYGFIISSFNTEYMATNGEAIYNLFFIASFYFFYLIVFEKKAVYIIPFLITIALGLFTKFQGAFSVFALLAYLIIAKPAFIIKKRQNIIKYFIGLTFIFIIMVVLLYIDWNYTKFIFSGYIRGILGPKINYSTARGFSLLSIFGRLMWRAFQFLLYHSILWIPGVLLIIKFFRNKNKKDEKEAYLITITLFLLLTVFHGGSRIYIHYFIPALPILSILAGKEIYCRIDYTRFKRLAFKIFIFPVIFFFLWNMKDAYIANYRPEWKHNESRFILFSRLILMGSYGEHLLPHNSLHKVLKYLQEETDRNATIFVWPMGTEVIYYSKRISATPQFWYNERALYAIVQKEKGNIKKFKRAEKSHIRAVKRYNPDYFVDVGSTSMIRKTLIYKKKDDPPYYFDLNTYPIIRFGSFGGLYDFPDLVKYLNKNFKFAGKFGDARVWKKIRE